MTTRLIIARHGNTFTKEQTPTRVGGRTDLPLVETERGTAVGKYLKQRGYEPVKVFAAPLKRTMETARLAVAAMDKDLPVEETDDFVEIDYGPDENKTEAEVINRLGRHYLEKEGQNLSLLSEQDIINKGEEVLAWWNEKALVPDGWVVSPCDIIATWKSFADKIEKEYRDKDVLLVSSNGVIRFAPYLTGDFATFAAEHDIKVTTGGVCVFEKDSGEENWRCTEWNVKAVKMV